MIAPAETAHSNCKRSSHSSSFRDLFVPDRCPHRLRRGLVIMILSTGCGAPGSSPPETGFAAAALSAIRPVPHAPACTDAPPRGFARCHARVHATPEGRAETSPAPTGYGPNQIRPAYALPVGTATTAELTVAVVDAFDDPTAEADLAVFRAHYGLPECTTRNGCFRKVNQRGVEGAYPIRDAGWEMEISLDLDAVSTGCPGCKILLVEADSNAFEDLGEAVNEAARLGPAAISNSYGAFEDDADPDYARRYYTHPGIAITVSTGDDGFGVQFPAASPTVIAVSGTSLAPAYTPRGWAEGVWDGAGSGCSLEFGKPGWQDDDATGCTHRTVADVAAVADPATGLAVYDGGNGGWLQVGGTSLSAPLVAAILTLTGKSGVERDYPYRHFAEFFDVTIGANGECAPAALCRAASGYDAATGVGSPNGRALARVP